MTQHGLREIRINPIIPAESVLIATVRGHRPATAPCPQALDRRNHVDDCPFCPGNEEQTPTELVRIAGAKGWRIRVVRNLYPAFGDDRQQPEMTMGMHHIIGGYGRHEVVIDHPQHGIFLSEMSVQHLGALVALYRDRMRDLYQASPLHRYVMVFKNFGPASGGSIPHTHSQVIAMPVVPANVEMEITSSLAYYRQNQTCIYCALSDHQAHYETTVYDRTAGELRRRIQVADYIIAANRRFVAIKPFASRHPWEVHLLPKKHSHDFRHLSDADALDLAELLAEVMLRLQKIVGIIQYNFFLHSAPAVATTADCHKAFHWHLEICPRTTIPNGFELGSGLAINSLSPEDAAEQLRAAL